MAEVIITEALKNEILKKFKGDSKEIFKLMYSLKENPKKGKEVGCVSNIVIKEMKYEGYRFYFITNGFRVKFLEIKDLQDLIIKFVRMSNKKEQQKVIAEIKDVLRKISELGF